MSTSLTDFSRTLISAPIQADIQPRYFTPMSVGLICLLVYINTLLAFREVGLTAQLLVFVVLVSLWFSLVGFRIRSAVFAAVVLQPATLLHGVGYLMLPGMALALGDLFVLIVIFLYLVQPQPLRLCRFTMLLWVLLGVCLLSVMFAVNPIAHTGQLIRLGLLLIFIQIIMGSPDDTLKRPVFYALLVWPFVALAQIAGQEYLWRFITFGEGRALNLAETGEVLLGSHLVVYHLFFLVPLLVYLRLPRSTLIIVIAYLTTLTVFSNSRSLVIGVGLGLILYMLFVRTTKNLSLVKVGIITSIFGGLVIGVATLGFFNFGVDEGSKATSSYIRIAKIEAAFNTYRDNPLLGIGFGAVGAIDSKRQEEWLHDLNVDFMAEIINVKASAETAPLQILAETGTLGGIVSLLILALGFRRILEFYRDSRIPLSSKFTLLVITVMFFVNFLGSNSFTSIPFFMAMPFVLGKIRWG